MMNFGKYFSYAAEIGFTDVEFKVKTIKRTAIGVYHHQVDEYTVSSVETCSIRGLINGSMVSGMTENKANICSILDDMKRNASLIEKKEKQELFAGSEKYRRVRTYNDELLKIPAADKIAFMLDLEQKCYDYDSRIADVQRCRYSETELAFSIVNTKGLKLNYRTCAGIVVAAAVAREEGDTRTGMKFVMGQKMSDFDAAKIAEEACKGAVNSLHAEQCRSGKYKVILHNGVFADFLEKWLNAVDGDMVNKDKSMLKDQMNQQVAGTKLTVTEDPFTSKFPFLARSFDDEGVATYKKNIVEKGVLKTFLYNLSTAEEAGVQSTGNGFGSSAIGTGTTSLSVKPGRRDLDGLAKAVKKGVLITSVAGMHSGMDPVGGNFSLQANGYLIEDGRIGTPLHLITIAGNLYEMFRDITEIGNDSELCMNDICTPSVVIRRLSVSGK